MDKQYLTVDDLVARWGNVISRGTLANWRSKRVGPPYVKLRARVVYPVNGVLEYEQANEFKNDNGEQGCQKKAE